MLKALDRLSPTLSINQVPLLHRSVSLRPRAKVAFRHTAQQSSAMATVKNVLPYTKLPNGASIQSIGYGLGTAAANGKKAGEFASSLDNGLVESVSKAISLGFYHLDGAESYTTDPELGKAVRDSKLPREKFFITTKLWPEWSIDDVAGAFDKSLKQLGVDYVDLYLIHEAFFANGDKKLLQQKWAEVEALQKSGRAKAIGVSNFFQADIEAILETAEIPPVINQIEFHPYLQHRDLVKFLKSKNIAIAAYAPQTPVIRAKGKLPEMDELLETLAKKYAVSPGEILLRWAIDQDIIPITTTSKESRLIDYLRAGAFKLTPKEVEDIATVGDKFHYRAFWAKKFAPDDRT